MYIPKRYGESRIDTCPFCGKQGTLKSRQGLIVCAEHKDSILPDIKCVCGSCLDLVTGKFGPYFVCLNCGNINLKKGLELLESMDHKQNKTSVKDGIVVDEGMYPGFDYDIDDD
jgi:hypothetical protein